MSDKQTDTEWKSDWMDSGVINHLVWSTPLQYYVQKQDANFVWLKQSLAVHIFHTIVSQGA